VAQVQRIKIPRMPDRSVIDCFYKLAKKYQIPTLNIGATAFSNIGAVNIEGDPNEDLEALLEHNSTLIESCSIAISGLTVIYHRGGQFPPEQKSPIFDEIHLNLNPQQGNLSNTDKFDIVALINDELKAYEPGRFIETGLSEEQNQLLSIHEGTLERLETLNEDLVRQSSDFRENLERKFEEKSTELEQQTNTKQEKIDSEYERKVAELQSKSQSLTDKLKAIDDRDNTHVRREIRDKMLSDVKSRIETFGVSKNTQNKRRPVIYGIILMVVTISLLLANAVLQLNKVPTQIDAPIYYWALIKVTFLSLVLLGTILYYIKWQNRWAEQHSNSEFQLQQFYIDVNRANWVIESCLEWRKETDSVIPTELLSSITNNLFENGSEELDKVVHPSDELASALLGSASKLKLKIGGSEMEFDKPGKIKKSIT